jgi:hypothetical protein
MTDFPLGISLTETDDGFLLRRSMTDAAPVEFKLSQGELFALKETTALWTDRILSRRQVSTGLQAIVAHPIAQVRVVADAMRQNVLLTVAAPSAEQMTFEMSPYIAQHLASEIPVVLAEMQQGNTTKQ